MTDELKSLVEDAAKLLGLEDYSVIYRKSELYVLLSGGKMFNPLDPERGDLMKVAEAAGLLINLRKGWLFVDGLGLELFHFTKGDHDSKVLAILRAASAVYKSRGGV